MPQTEAPVSPSPHPNPPRATARLQLHAGFPFAEAARQIDYYAALGVSHLYLSPIFSARPGSTHGYDVTDFGTINPELGGEEGFRAFASQAQAAGLGLIIDIVPNHMAANAAHNGWWRDVLARGAESPYADHFDIDWHSPDPDLHGKVLLPILGRPYWETLSSGDITVARDDARGQFTLRYGDHDLPLSEDSIAATEISPATFDARDPAGLARLHELLEQQHYRLAWWRTAAEELNWRRFFEVSELVGVRVEEPPVFDAVHALVLRLMREGWIDGVRVDHVDGLADPGTYCQQLRAHLTAAAAERPVARALTQPWIVVEKILAEQETLRAEWQVDGTTGYDFMNEVGALLHDGAGEAALDTLWHAVTGERPDYAAMVREARRYLLERHLVAEYEGLCRRLHACAREEPATRDLTLASLRRAVAGLMEPLDVYRTYLSERSWSREDKLILEAAAESARVTIAPDEPDALDQLVNWLRAGPHTSPSLRDVRARAQQLMPPLAAKASEDTVFYRYGRLLSRNEVGSYPATLAMQPERFHARMAARAQAYPRAMLATATHDHKRGEDTRMRLAVLSELAEEWSGVVHEWEQRCTPRFAERQAPDGADRLMLYQTLVGAWPPDLDPSDQAGVRAFLERVQAWQLKSIREGKRHGNWTHPDTAYEEACAAFVDGLAFACVEQDSAAGTADANGDAATPLAAIAGFARRIATAGAVNSLAQTLIELTAPGVPDRYQGTETWDFSLVDPDNRRPVDFEHLRRNLECTAGWDAWLDGWRDGRVKTQLIRRVLARRGEHEALFSEGAYRELRCESPLPGNVFAFERRRGAARAITVTARLCARYVSADSPRIATATWGDTTLNVGEAESGEWVETLTGRTVTAVDGRLRVADVLHTLPVALLMRA
ncbi:malto-oligosyltrehalose synthase [Cupriavidus respiraculi]|uniref:Maltooligosyl trehalose synthase n=2 Tax=Cupriavidus respiraculi TaxID=195930 RepID=A0ABN7YZ10_9BURK|nr:malto-oligosyltrehalose synthase [Cupriavidus respiraculi]CAG9178948.1 Maltooligosyl trehalose synthase [Cupriavidus respiraculi]